MGARWGDRMTMRGVKQLVLAFAVAVLIVWWLTGCAAVGPLAQIAKNPGEDFSLTYKREGLKYTFECSGSGTLQVDGEASVPMPPALP